MSLAEQPSALALHPLSAAISRGDGPRELATLAVEALAAYPHSAWAAVAYDLGDGLVIARTVAAPGDALLARAVDLAASSDATSLPMIGREAGATVIRRLGGRARPVGVLLGSSPEDVSAADADVVAALLGTALELRRLSAENNRLQEASVESERLASVGSMTAGIAHEIRNPLVSIRTFTQLLPERYQDPEFRDSFLDLTLSEVDRICTLVGELLAFASPASGDDCDGADPAACAERVTLLMGPLAKTSSVSLHCEPGPMACQVSMNGDRLEQVLLNLVSNAVAACEDGGKVRIVISPSEQDVRIDVCDDGVGMEAEVARRVFETFYTTRSEGTGLGLAITKRLIEEASGRVDLHSVAGAGTTISLTLPYVCEAVAEEPIAVHA